MELKAYLTKELAELYGVSAKTFNNWIKPIRSKLGTKQSKYYTPKQVALIFDFLNPPN